MTEDGSGTKSAWADHDLRLPSSFLNITMASCKLPRLIPLTLVLPPTPAGGGVLPYWLLITSVASVYNVVQNYVTLKQSKEIYSSKPDQSKRY